MSRMIAPTAVRPLVGALLLAGAAMVTAQTPATPAPAAGPVTGTCNYSPIVGNLDKAIAFYQLFGLDFGAATAPTRTFDAKTPLLDMHGVGGAEMRWAAARVPGGRCGVEIVEFRKIDRQPVQPRPQDPGATTLVLIVRDIEPMLARVKQAGVAVVSAGGNVIPLPNGRGAAVLFRDPDGHFVELLQLNPQPGATAPEGTDNIVGWRARVVVENTDAAVALYRDRLGFQVPPVEFAANKVFTDLNGLPDVPVRITNADLPGATRVELVEFNGMPHSAVHPRIQDPGATRLQLQVGDAAAVGKLVKQAGGTVVSTRGEVFELPAGRSGAAFRVTVARDPNNLYLVLTQSPTAAR
jgi:catechol 2,3-dioxygenase-like lactoylglutathione lyase family enzyme